MRMVRSVVLLALSLASGTAIAQAPAPSKPYQVEWVYKVRYGFQDEWWRIFQKYQVAAFDEEKRRGYVQSYSIVRPGEHAGEDSRWDYRIVITYRSWEGSQHEGEVLRALFSDRAALTRDDNRRWELTLNHWDLPIHEIDPHAEAEGS